MWKAGWATLATAWSGGIQEFLDTPIQTENVAECNSFSIIARTPRLTMGKSVVYSDYLMHLASIKGTEVQTAEDTEER